MRVEYTPRGLVGVLTPQANTTVEPEFAIMLPRGIGMINARMMSSHTSLEARLLDYFANLDQHVLQFANAPVDVFALATTGPSYLVGVEKEHETIERLEQTLGVPFVTSAQAVIRALHVLKAQRIGIVSPYPSALTQASAIYWRANGFDVSVVSQVTGDGAAFHPIYSIDARSAGDGLEQMRNARIDAVLMLGTGMPTLASILKAKSLLAVPTISCMLCLGWACVDAIEPSGEHASDTLHSWIRGDDWGQRLHDRQWPAQN
jgi:maleate cis-trans isomerase